ncbi:MAG: Putative endoribonuclease L-PSP [Bacteroidetes bacterium 38_7]|nr:MAG: Putative endoribonuclease L-PSP [Bacteroidetes bacterium 38_7]HAL64883.1 reactive intermediate/imine deaminase [Bacteroidales bacterium]HQN99290.1 RidA family protein [Bacteroidales bacterium]HQQ01488.1 RidA family protein [Bacteroidales bacterium]
MKKIIFSNEAPKAIGPYSQANEANGFLFISGQIPIDPSSGQLVDGGIKEQTHQVMKNIGAILKEAGLDYKDVVKCTCLLSNMEHFSEMNLVYAQYFTIDAPARAAYGVVKLPMGALIEIECIAVR